MFKTLIRTPHYLVWYCTIPTSYVKSRYPTLHSLSLSLSGNDTPKNNNNFLCPRRRSEPQQHHYTRHHTYPIPHKIIYFSSPLLVGFYDYVVPSHRKNQEQQLSLLRIYRNLHSFRHSSSAFHLERLFFDEHHKHCFHGKRFQ